MHGTRGTSNFRSAVIFVAMAVALNGCLKDKDETSSDQDIGSDNQLSGSVGDGPVVGALMTVRRNDGQVRIQSQSDVNAGYDITARTKGRYYPLTIRAIGGTDLVTNSAPDFDLVGAVLNPGKRTIANVNPFTTLVIEVARALPGGLTSENILTAES